jgi:hypothetical protein
MKESFHSALRCRISTRIATRPSESTPQKIGPTIVEGYPDAPAVPGFKYLKEDDK